MLELMRYDYTLALPMPHDLGRAGTTLQSLVRVLDSLYAAKILISPHPRRRWSRERG